MDASLDIIVAERYRLSRLIKHGGMGVVYEAFDMHRGEPCAVKLLSSPELNQHPEVVRRFCREARACSALVSEHIVTVLDSGIDDGTGVPYLVMELLQGEDLEKLLARLGPLDPWVAAKIALQLAKGMATAHAAGVLHRDIKPGNVFLSVRDSEEIVATLLDFGVAKVRVESSLDVSGALTQTGSLLGTPLYMSPEQACGASNVDARSDVWSLGAVLFEMLTGSVPFGNPGNFGALMVSLLTEDLPLVQDRAPWVPPEIAEITHRALARQLSFRFRDARALHDALAALMPSEAKLYRNELAPVSSDRRSRSARRIQHLNAGLVRPPRSAPQARAHRRLRSTVAVIAAASSLGAIVAFGTADPSPAPDKGAPVTTASGAVVRSHVAGLTPEERPAAAPVAREEPPPRDARRVGTRAERPSRAGAPTTPAAAVARKDDVAAAPRARSERLEMPPTKPPEPPNGLSKDTQEFE